MSDDYDPDGDFRKRCAKEGDYLAKGFVIGICIGMYIMWSIFA